METGKGSKRVGLVGVFPAVKYSSCKVLVDGLSHNPYLPSFVRVEEDNNNNNNNVK